MKVVARRFENQTAMVRLVLNIKGYNHRVADLDIKSSSVFPMGFTFCVDSREHFYCKIAEQIKNHPSRLLAEVVQVDPGIYELVAEFRGKVELDENGKFVDSVWKIYNPHLYQLTEEDAQHFGVAG